jgi:hypothetical protein
LAFDEKASMPQRSLSRVSGILALAVTASFLPPLVATADDAAATGAFIDEVRHSFTLNGKPIPPEIFRDFGDGDLADSGSIWVTVDVKAAIGSNLYFDDIKQNGSWINQKKALVLGPSNTRLGRSAPCSRQHEWRHPGALDRSQQPGNPGGLGKAPQRCPVTNIGFRARSMSANPHFTV